MLKGHIFAYEGYAMGNNKIVDIGKKEKELIEGLEEKLEEDFGDGFFGDEDDFFEDEDDFFDDDMMGFLPFVESVYDMPIINHTKGFTDENFGYAQGVTQDGIPFAAEVYDVDEREILVLYIPAIYSFSEDKDNLYDEANRITELRKERKNEIDVLDIGMIYAGDKTLKRAAKMFNMEDSFPLK